MSYLYRIQDLDAPDNPELVERSQENTVLSSIEERTRKVHFKDDQPDSSSMEESDDDSEDEDSDDFTSGSCEENEEDRQESKTQVINFKHSQTEERLQPQEVCIYTYTCNSLTSFLQISLGIIIIYSQFHDRNTSYISISYSISYICILTV